MFALEVMRPLPHKWLWCCIARTLLFAWRCFACPYCAILTLVAYLRILHACRLSLYSSFPDPAIRRCFGLGTWLCHVFFNRCFNSCFPWTPVMHNCVVQYLTVIVAMRTFICFREACTGVRSKRDKLDSVNSKHKCWRECTHIFYGWMEIETLATRKSD